MKVLLVSTSSGSRGGGELFLVYLAEALRQIGYEPALWCAAHSRMDELVKRFEPFGDVYRDHYPNSYLDRRLRLFSAAFDGATIRRLAQRLAKIPCNLIHLNKQTLEDGLDLLEATRLSGKPVVSTIHITQTNRELGAFCGRIRDDFSIRRLNRAHEVSWTAVSDARSDELTRSLIGDVHTVYNAVAEASLKKRDEVRESILSRLKWPSDSLLVGCVARLVAQKNPSRFLRLAATLHRKNQSTRFVWIGDGDLRESFLDEAKELGIGEVVHCTGWLDQPRDLLSGLDLYLHPAVYEGLPLAILEAMAAGLPCVLSPEIASEMRAFDASSVILTRNGSDEWVSQANDFATRSRYSTASLRLYQEYFRPEVMAHAFAKIYQNKLA